MVCVQPSDMTNQIIRLEVSLEAFFFKACTQSCSLNPESTFLVIHFLRRPTTMYLTTFPRGEVRIICFDMKLF
jgi:hypothetical protein